MNLKNNWESLEEDFKEQRYLELEDLEGNYEEDSLVTLLEIKNDVENEDETQFVDFITDEQLNEREKNENKNYISDNMTKSKSIEPKVNMTEAKQSTLNFTTIDPMKISKSSTTPKSRVKKIKSHISVVKSAKSTRETMPSSKKSTKEKQLNSNNKTSCKKLRKVASTEGSKTEGRRRVSRISKKSMDRIWSNPNEKSGGNL